MIEAMLTDLPLLLVILIMREGVLRRLSGSRLT
jgi:hypothetical protein